MQDTTAWNQEQHTAARNAIALYKAKLRPLIREADLYHVSDRPDGIHWDGIEYLAPTRGKGVLFAFHGSSTQEPSHTFVLRGLNPKQTYRLVFHDHPAQSRTASGSELMKKGLRVVLPMANSSELVFLSAAPR